MRLFRRLLRRDPVALDSLAAYAKWAAAYPPHAHNALMETEEAAMLALMPDVGGLRVLDLASGTGRYAQITAAGGAAIVIALDNSVPMLANNAASSRVCATLIALPFSDQSVDVIVCGLAVGHVSAPDLHAALIEIGRVLKRGGAALISDVHPFLFLNGAQRTFSVGSTTYAVEHHVHLLSEIHAAAQRAGLTIDAMREPVHGGRQVPVAVVYKMRRLA